MSYGARNVGPRARAFLRDYPAQREGLVAFAHFLEQHLRDVLRPLNLDIHLITARAKATDSVISKVRRKRYGAPTLQLTDRVGARVIAYYEEDVDPIADHLRKSLVIDARRSVDKRHELGIRQFGYRSVHLVACLPPSVAKNAPAPFQQMYFEVQIRSILEHAWAEIEHEVCYKSGVVFPAEIKRRFSALAGTLEILDGEFSKLRIQRDALIREYAERYAKGEEEKALLDSARLVALLEYLRPRADGWRVDSTSAGRFPPRSDAACVEVLASVGINNARQFKRSLGSRRAIAALENYASLNSVAPEQVSHLACVLIVVGIRGYARLAGYPELSAFVPQRDIFRERAVPQGHRGMKHRTTKTRSPRR